MVGIGLFFRAALWWGLMLLGAWFLYRTGMSLSLHWLGRKSHRPLVTLLGLMAALIDRTGSYRRQRIQLVYRMIDGFARGPSRWLFRRRFRAFLRSPPDLKQQARLLRRCSGPAQCRSFFQLLLSLSVAHGSPTRKKRESMRMLGREMGLAETTVRRLIRDVWRRQTGKTDRSRARGSRRSSGASTRKASTRRRAASRVLGVSPWASPETIREAYQEKVKQFHPDQFRDSDEKTHRQAEEKMARINRAYQILRETG